MTLYEKMKVKLYGAVSKVNEYANQEDVNRNHVNYGIAATCADVLRELGHEVDVPCWGDNGYLRIPKIIIDGEVSEF